MTSTTQVAPSLRLGLRPHGAWRLALFGVPLRIDISWPLGLALAAWTLAGGILPEAAPGRGMTAYAVAGAAGATLLMLSLALHEVGHCVAALRAGVQVTRVTLSLIGGACELAEAPCRPATDFRIAVAGPLTSVACALAAAVAHVLLVEDDADPLTAAVAAALVVGNALLAGLNALPGLPLDGGRIARAALWALSGREPWATRVCAITGRVVAAAMLGIALIASASGDAAAGVWCGFLGVVLLQHDSTERALSPRTAARG
jgi:Zn-dependent protease